MDAVTQFYPWYSYLGESLRSGNIPGWNPYQLSGVPFAGAPLSGWAYLPAMVLFTLLPLGAAAAGYLLAHLLLAGLGTYALARALRMNVAGALLAAVAYEFTGYLLFRSVCCLAFSGIYAWLPLALLGAELAIRSTRWLDRGLWWGVGGLALSQLLAAWPGQGSYYALLALGGYVAYRTLLFPPENIRGILGRVSVLASERRSVAPFGFALAAAGVLPLLEYNALSNLAGGYAEEDATRTHRRVVVAELGLAAGAGQHLRRPADRCPSPSRPLSSPARATPSRTSSPSRSACSPSRDRGPRCCTRSFTTCCPASTGCTRTLPSG